MNLLKIDLKRAILNKSMILAVLIGLISIIIGIIMVPLRSAIALYISRPTDISELQKISLMKNALNKVTLWHFGNYIYPFVMPLICCIPFNSEYVKDKASGFSKYIIIRSNYKKYISSKISVTFLSGFLTIFITSSLAYTFILLIDSGENYRSIFYTDVFLGSLSNNSFDLFVFIYIIICSFMGGIYSLLGLAISTITNNKLIATISPFIIYYISSYIFSTLETIFLNPMLVNKFYSYRNINGMPILFQLITLSIFSILLFIYKTYWSDCFE